MNLSTFPKAVASMAAMMILLLGGVASNAAAESLTDCEILQAEVNDFLSDLPQGFDVNTYAFSDLKEGLVEATNETLMQLGCAPQEGTDETVPTEELQDCKNFGYHLTVLQDALASIFSESFLEALTPKVTTVTEWVLTNHCSDPPTPPGPPTCEEVKEQFSEVGEAALETIGDPTGFDAVLALLNAKAVPVFVEAGCPDPAPPIEVPNLDDLNCEEFLTGASLFHASLAEIFATDELAYSIWEPIVEEIIAEVVELGPCEDEPPPEPEPCSKGLTFTTNGAGHGYCIQYFDLPDTRVRMDCTELFTEGVVRMGYLSEDPKNDDYECPQGMEKSVQGKLALCTRVDIIVSQENASAYCHWVNLGYWGWNFPLEN